jgi:hypothetical protein
MRCTPIVRPLALVRILGGLSAPMDHIHQTSRVSYGSPLLIDVGLTYSIRH